MVKLTKKEMTNILFTEKQQIFTTPLDVNEVKNSVAKSVSKKDYNYKCPPKFGAITPICNKDLCKFRKLGIGSQVPDLIDDFDDINLLEHQNN